jgi:hypothetical protein
MPPFSPDRDAFVAEAAALARELAPDLQAVLITVYPDADTLDTLRPGETDIETATAVARAVAAEMADAGVELFVQRADKSAFRRWLQGQVDTPDHRRAWIDRERLLRGPAARQALGLPPAETPPPTAPAFPKAPGPIADQLLDAFADETGENFAGLADALIAAGRDDVLDLAIRKLDAADGEDAADDLLGALLEAAEGTAIGPAGWAELVALPVALPTGAAPDAVALAAGLRASGALAPTEDIRLLPGWRSSDAIADLAPVAVRRILTDLVAGREPRDLPPGDTDELATHGFGVLLGLRIDWDLPIWDALAAGDLPNQSAEDSPEDTRRAALFDQWRGVVFQTTEGCVPLALVPLSEVGAEIADFLDEAGAQTGGLMEIRNFIEAARTEAGGEDIVCRPEIIGASLELSLYTAQGRFLDSRTWFDGQLPARAEDMPKLLKSFVSILTP